MQVSVLELKISLKKNQNEFKGELKVEKEGHLQLLKQEFERFFPDSSNTELLQLKMSRNPFQTSKFFSKICKKICKKVNSFRKFAKKFLKIKCKSIAKTILKLSD